MRKHCLLYFEKGHGGSNLRRVSDHVFEALHLKGTEMVGQTDGEDHLKLGKFLEAAEDNVHSRGRKRRKDIK